MTTIEPLFALSVIPGIDGIGLEFGGREALLLPDELMREGLLTGYRPLPSIDFFNDIAPRHFQPFSRLHIDHI